MVIAEAQKYRKDDIFKLNRNIYAFDYTTIDLCLGTFEWALFRKKKGGVKIHTLYDLETQIPTFFHITTAKVHDTKAMDVIPYEENSFYIFDRGYNDFRGLYNIESIGAYFAIRGKKNNDFKSKTWKRRFPPKSGTMSDAIGYMDASSPWKSIQIRSVESFPVTMSTKASLYSSQMHLLSALYWLQNYTITDGRLNFSSSGLSNILR